MNHFITVFTPTYNRANLLPKLYESLKKQTFKDFEWLIVDDGSNDKTESVIKNFISESKIKIRYYYQINGGKHRAINKALQLANGKFFFIVDSDDILPENSLELISTYSNKIDSKEICGVVGRIYYKNGEKLNNDPSKGEIIANTIELRYKHNIHGDLAEVVLTDILKKYPFPEFEGEKFCAESLVFNRIAKNYKLYFFDKCIYFCEYLEDGLSRNNTKHRMKSPTYAMKIYAELITHQIPFDKKLKAVINYWRFSVNSKKPFFKKVQEINHFYTLLALPVGIIMHLNDLRKIK
jgi:glycosyltransferase involved in cell wall biosynthesis